MHARYHTWPDDRISLPLENLTIGRSDSLDYMGRHYHFVVFSLKSGMDGIVGASMYRTGGRWEPGLLNLYDRVVKTYKNTADHAIVDIGANFGAFSLHAASKGARVFAYEMQPMVYSILEMSRRLNGYHNMILTNVALSNVSDMVVRFTPVTSNFGETLPL